MEEYETDYSNRTRTINGRYREGHLAATSHLRHSLQVTCRKAPSTHPMGVESRTEAHGALSTARL